MAESGFPGFEATNWWGILAPAGTPEPVITRLNTEFVRILSLPDVKERFAQMGNDAVTSSPAEFSQFIKTEIARYSKLIAEIGIKPE